MRSFLVLILVSTFSLSVQASAQNPDGWQFELTPYAWLTGIDGDATVLNREVEVDAGFSDLIDAVDIAGSLLGVAQYNRWVMLGQFDYAALDSDNLDNEPERTDLEVDSIFATAAFGYQFNTFGEHSTMDVLVGVRYLDMENEIRVGNTVDRSSSVSYTDAIFMLRPSFRINDWIRFNPTLSVGAGDSDLTYELQPQFQFQLSELMALRVGYRRLYYDVESDKGGFDGAFHGAIVGLGFTF